MAASEQYAIPVAVELAPELPGAPEYAAALHTLAENFLRLPGSSDLLEEFGKGEKIPVHEDPLVRLVIRRDGTIPLPVGHGVPIDAGRLRQPTQFLQANGQF